MHSITQQLQKFYDNNAKHFSQTRQKHRSDLEYITKYINQLPGKTVKILELWCGNGKSYEYLEKNIKKKITYTGVDLSKELLAVAQKSHPTIRFIHEDMVQYIQKEKQSSVDIILSVAAFHHLPTIKDRLLVLKNAYRLLKYDGYCIMTNRSRSEWFIQRYRKQILVAFCRSIRSWSKWNDIYVDRNTSHKKITWTRYYHMFTRNELDRLSKQSGFVVKENNYISEEENTHNQRRKAKNILTILKKSIKKHEL